MSQPRVELIPTRESSAHRWQIVPAMLDELMTDAITDAPTAPRRYGDAEAIDGPEEACGWLIDRYGAGGVKLDIAALTVAAR